MLRPTPPPLLPPPSATAWVLLPLSLLADGAMFWPAACLVAIAAAGARHYGAMLIWYGLAVGFDLHALILAPFIVAILIGARVSWRTLPLAPGFALAMLLARTHGLSPGVRWPPSVATDAPTLWAMLDALPWIGTLPLTGMALASAVGAAATYVAWAATRPVGLGSVRDAALLCALALPVLTPGLDLGAFLLAAGLAVHIALIDHDTARWRIAGLVGIGMLVAGHGGVGAAPLGALATLGATLLQLRYVFKRGAANDNRRTGWVVSSPPRALQHEIC